MSASQYENLIRAIFQCEEGRKHGATADIYYNLLDARIRRTKNGNRIIQRRCMYW